ncbi:MAG: hypothetical protein WCG87_06925 [Bacteroidota bacterium]
MKRGLLLLLLLLPIGCFAQDTDAEVEKKPKDLKESEARAIFFGNVGFMKTYLSSTASSLTGPLSGYFVGAGMFLNHPEHISNFQIEGNIYRLKSQYKDNGDVTYLSICPSLGINMVNRRDWAVHFSLGGGLQLTTESIMKDYVSLNASLGARYRLVALRMGANIGLSDIYNNEKLNNIFSTPSGTLTTVPMNVWIGLSFYPQLF